MTYSFRSFAECRVSRRASSRFLSIFGERLLVGLLALPLAASTALFARPALAQELAGTFTGTVTDPSGGVIPKATVTIKLNGVGGEARTVQTNDSGSFTATNLPAGTYTITIVSPGFQTYTDQNVVLNVAQKRAVDASLKLGSADTVVTVEDNPISIDTVSSSQAGTISGTQVRELELNNRNFQQLVTLQPGVVNMEGDEPGFGSANSQSALSINGARTNANNWSVDGADINDSGSNSTLLNIPSIDAIQEFTLERSSYDASFGRSGGGQVVVATRSGTSQFHGGAYEFVRTANTNANSYFNNRAGLARDPDHYNNFGFTIGGPLYIPHFYNTNRNKTFFFWSEEWRKITSPSDNAVAAPTAAELAGTFNVTPSQYASTVAAVGAGCVSAYNPVDIKPGEEIGTATVNQACYSANSKVYLDQIFSKNPSNFDTTTSTGVTYGTQYAAFSTLNNFRQDLVRVDHYFSDKLHFFGRAMQDDAPQSLPTGLWTGANYPGVVNVALNGPGKNVVGNLTYTISPTIVNEVEFAYSQGTISGALSGPANSPSVLSSLTNNLANPDPYGRIPTIGITDGSVTGVNIGSAPYFERNLDRNIFDNLSVTLRNHTLRAGVTFQQMLKTEDGTGGNPSFSFQTWGDFLLGNSYQYTQASRDIVPDLHFWNSEAYVQDDWKLNHRLTVNLGLRWSRFPSPSDVKNTLNNFDPSVYQASLAPALDADGNFAPGQQYTPSTYTNGIIFPKGSACTQAQAISAQVTCSRFGNLVNPNSNMNFGPRVGFAWTPFAEAKTVLRGGFGVFFDRTLNGIWEQNAFSDPPLVQYTTITNTSFDNPVGNGAALPPGLGPNGLTTTGTPTFKVPSYVNYNLSVQQQLASTTTLELAYVGNQGRHLLGELDLNMPTLATRAANPNSALNNIRPFLGYSDFHTRLPVFTSNYNSLQVQLKHQTRRDVTVGIAYTWSKSLSTQSSDRGTANTYTYNPKLDYGPTSFNVPQILVANFVYKEPFFREQHGLAGHTLGGWELSGIVDLNSGASTYVTQQTDPFACVPDASTSNGCAAGTYPGGLGLVNPNGDIVPRVDQIAPIHLTKTQAQWFTTSSFLPAVGHFGSEHSGAFAGPGQERLDLGLMKNFRFTESVNLQLRAEAFNVFNHTNFASVDTGFSSGTFGQLTSAHEPRIMQFSGKFYF